MQIFKPAGNLLQAVLDFTLPPRCLSCSKLVSEHGNICPECFGEFKIIGKHQCHCCGLPFEFDMGEEARCKFCIAEKPKFRQVRAFCYYEGTGRKLAIKLKFGDGTYLAPHISRLMANSYDEALAKADIISPIPLHFRRKLGRKYNQAGLLAKNIAKARNIDYQPLLLKRVRHTKSQTRLNRENRQKNVENAFAATHGSLKGKTILLVDDVMTTGATMNECAKVLRKAGAHKVYGIVFARVVPERC